jgi:hypothetical protein
MRAETGGGGGEAPKPIGQMITGKERENVFKGAVPMTAYGSKDPISRFIEITTGMDKDNEKSFNYPGTGGKGFRVEDDGSITFTESTCGGPDGEGP